jgi:hypothetical protein
MFSKTKALWEIGIRGTSKLLVSSPSMRNISRIERVLTMMYNARDYWVFGLVHRAVFWTLKNTTFLKLDLFPPSGEAVGDAFSIKPVRKS